jgi:hypothetical protein
MAKTPREITPVTGAEWRRLGFYHELDPDRRVWRLCGSRSGLIAFGRLIAGHADSVAASSQARPLRLGPYGDLQIKFWERPGIDDESIYGRPDDLRRLAELIESRLAELWPGGQLVIGAEYAGDAECSLVFEVMDADFDPATAARPIPAEDHAPERVAMSPHIAFKFHNPGSERVWEGLVRLEDADLVMQYEKKANVFDHVAEFFGREPSGVMELIVPLSEVTTARFKRGVFGAKLTVQVSDISILGDVPRTKAGTIRLDFRRDDRDEAADLAAALDELLGQAERGGGRKAE